MNWIYDNWKTSPVNYYDDVRSKLNIPEKVEIHDTTLRDGEQASGVQFSFDEKIAIAEKLMDARIDRIEVCMPAVSAEDQRALREIAKRKRNGVKLAAFCRAIPKDVRLAADCGADLAIVEIPACAETIATYGWTFDETIEKGIKAIEAAQEAGMKANLFLMDGSRGELGELLEIIRRVRAGVRFDALTLVDTLGVLGPDSVAYMARAFRDVAGDAALEIHCHDDYGLAVANTVAGVTNGACGAHTTVNGLGDRAGGAPTEEVVMALRAIYNAQIGADTTQFKSLCDLVGRCSRRPVPVNKAIVGDNLFTTESGIPAMIMIRSAKAGKPYRDYFPMDPTCVGFPGNKFVLGKFSGEYSVRYFLEAMGIELAPEKVRSLVGMIKDRSIETGELLTLDDFVELIKAIRA